MTEEELKHIPFHLIAHLSLEDEHCTTYIIMDVDENGYIEDWGFDESDIREIIRSDFNNNDDE